ncbi:CCAAT/enhancer-binding protein zeta [Anopheles funestus]|uniref:CCAAT/enhancer-binding protein zeta n=1 Tax=Anopheles funestus TaxID=62324 RepID=UPI0020C7464B|nr:CCAAT/enhancer-binding protein zeta [Anopheles funestus]
MAIGAEKIKNKGEKKRSIKQQSAEAESPAQVKSEVKKQPAKIIFDDDGEQRVVPIDYTAEEPSKHQSGKRKHASADQITENSDSEGEENADELAKQWYTHFEAYNLVGQMEDMKDAEIAELRRICRAAFEVESRARKKDDPSDAKWLLSALEKGTLRDRANAGALLVQTNPFCHLQALDTLVAMVKTSNKGYLDLIEVLTDLMTKTLMPSYRKLITIPMRGADWKHLQKQENLEKSKRDTIYAHWHFEDQLREHYFTFVSNCTMILHNGQDGGKLKTIGYVGKLFVNVPEMERLMLTALVNKLGDPSHKVAAKVMSQLQYVVRQHTLMSLIVTTEVEKLLFRNNVAQSAQHFALAYLASIASLSDFAACEKMINICFAFFKIHIEKGEVNSRTMQSILICLRKAIKNVKRSVDLAEILDPKLLNVIYRIVHWSNISISCQCLALLLEITERKGYEQNRFYNALYRKMVDPQFAFVGPRISHTFFYILHRAMQTDPIKQRAQAFVKRILQVAFHLPAAQVCGALIVISQVLRTRRILRQDGQEPPTVDALEVVAEESNCAENDDGGSDVEEEDGKIPAQTAVPTRMPTKYNAFSRSSEFAGAQYSLKYELVRYLSHFHPTVQKFAQSILTDSALTYHGDPLVDFSLGRFLDRFAFKNPKKPRTEKDENGVERLRPRIIGAQRKSDYVPSGSRGMPLDTLTKDQCAEDDAYIFKYLEQKRYRMERAKQLKLAKGEKAEDSESDVESLNDDEFDAYLDSLGVPGANGHAVDVDGEAEMDFMQELEQEMVKERKGKKSTVRRSELDDEDDGDDDDDGGLDDWDDVGEEEDDSGQEDESDDDQPRTGRVRREVIDKDGGEFSDGGSISLDEDEDFDGDEMMDDESDDEPDGEEPVPKKRKKLPSRTSGGMVSERDFARKLKTADMSSLFAAADDFSELLESNVDPAADNAGRNGKRKGGGSIAKATKQQLLDAHGTEAEVFNQDQSSVKQLAWEAKRFSDRNSRNAMGGRGEKQFGGQRRAGRAAGTSNFQKRGGDAKGRFKKMEKRGRK